jgi:cyclopropane fatty-acyl-phospholipid synthase-like methyltransferase
MEGERFANSAESEHFLVSGKRSYIGGSHEAYSDLWSAALRTARSIRTGVPQAMHDFSAMAEEELRAFLRGLDPGAVAAAKSLARHFDFAGYTALIDLAAGSGGLAMELCRRFPDLTATAVDLPNVAAITKDFIAEAGLQDRVGVQACDVVAAAPAGEFDVAVLRSFLQVIPPDAARRAVIHAGQALSPGGDIYIVGRVLDDSRLGPPQTVAFNVVFLNIYDGGQAHTEGRHRQWLSEAGFIDIARKQLGGGYSVIRARKGPVGGRGR